MADKVYTPQQAAMMVLAKAQELYKSSDLAKGDWNKIHNKLEREGYSKESADKIDGSIKAKLGKSEEFPPKKDESKEGSSEKNPDEKQDAQLGEKVEHEVEAHEAANPEAEKQEHREKGSYKLAKFMGKMEMKKSQKAAPEMDKAETGYEKGVNTAVQHGRADAPTSTSAAGVGATASARGATPHGVQVGTAQAKSSHQQTLDQIHQMSKPKLPG